MTGLRGEEDAIGSVWIKREKLFGIQTYRSVENLSFSGRSLADYPVYLKALVKVKKAAALANGEAGLLSGEIKEAVLIACDMIINDDYREHFPIDTLSGGGSIATNMNVNEVLSNLANLSLGRETGIYCPVHPGDHVNASQSTADVCHTAIRIAILEEMEVLISKVVHLKDATAKKAEDWKSVSSLSRTCLQDGMAVNLGDSLSGVVTMLTRRIRSLNERKESMYAVNLGGTVIGSGSGARVEYRQTVMEYLRQTTALPMRRKENLYDAAQHIDDLGDLASELKQLANGLIKFAKDLRLRSSGPEGGFGEITLPAVQAGSSFFPGKINPVVPETLIQCCFQVLGSERIVQAALEHGELDLNVFEGAAGMAILDALSMLNEAIPKFTGLCIEGMTVNEQRCRDLSNSTIPLVVELKESYGYHTVSTLLQRKGVAGLQQLKRDGGENK